MLVRVPVSTYILLYCSQPIAKFRYFLFEIAQVKHIKNESLLFGSVQCLHFSYAKAPQIPIFFYGVRTVSLLEKIEITCLNITSSHMTSQILRPNVVTTAPAVLKMLSLFNRQQMTMMKTTRTGTTTTRRPPRGRGRARRRRNRRRTGRAVR